MKRARSTVGSLLSLARENQDKLLASFGETGVRVSGLNDLLEYLDHLVSESNTNEALRALAFFARRARQDVQTSIVALYSGMIGNVSDAMRDMMEMSFLLREFKNDGPALDRWFTMDRKRRRQLFSPGRLRQLHANRLGIDIGNLGDARDYGAHSQALHVQPESELIRRGLIESPEILLEIDVGLAEIFGHSEQFANEYFAVAKARAPASSLRPPETAAAFISASENSREFTQSLLLSLLRVTAETDPTADPPE